MTNSILIEQIFKTVFLAFLLLLYANHCSITHVWTFIFKSFHPSSPLESLPNILKAISQQELKHFKSVKGGKFNFTFHTISFAILSKYSYYELVMRLPTMKCTVMLCSHTDCVLFCFLGTTVNSVKIYPMVTSDSPLHGLQNSLVLNLKFHT